MLDVPLLIECGWYKEVDLVWLVAVDEQTQVERAMARSGMSQQEVEVRIAAQMTLAAKCQYADLIIDNSGSLKQTELTVKKNGKKYYRWRIEFGQTSKKKNNSRKIWFVLILLCAVSLLGWKIWTSDEVQMRFVYMWPYQGEILNTAEKQD
ncbi:MAG: dephospho-CoA kinase [Phascolarctobacterium faecium]